MLQLLALKRLPDGSIRAEAWLRQASLFWLPRGLTLSF